MKQHGFTLMRAVFLTFGGGGMLDVGREYFD